MVLELPNEVNYPLTISKLLEEATVRFPGNTIVYGKHRIKTSEFRERVMDLASFLQNEVGVKKGDVVAVIDWDTLSYLEAYYAVPMIGSILHTVNIRYPPEIIFYTMQHANDSAVIISAGFLPVIEKYAQLFDFVRAWIIIEEEGEVKSKLSRTFRFPDTAGGHRKDFNVETDENSVATLFYTSGTTGMPKGISFTQRQLFLHTLSVRMSSQQPPLNVSERDVAMPLVPMFHVHQWGFPYFALYGGLKYVLPGKYDFEKLPLLMESEHVTYSACVPSILYMLMESKSGKERKKIFSGLKMLIGGSALPTGLANKALELGVNFVCAYGLSETCPAVTAATDTSEIAALSEEKKVEYRMKAGVPFPMVEVDIVDSNMKKLEHDGTTAGEIVVRAPWCTSGYYRDPEKTEKLWQGGWLHTGDIGAIDRYGYLQVLDREKDAIKSGGEFISSLLLESAISECEGVAEVAVIGIQDEKWGERPVAAVVRKGHLDEKKIREHLEELASEGRIRKWWIPDRIVFVESMPKTSTGKVDKKEVRKMPGMN